MRRVVQVGSGEGEEGAEGDWSGRVVRVVRVARVVAGEAEAPRAGWPGRVGAVGTRGQDKDKGKGKWWAMHLSSWASPAGIHLVGARVGARVVADSISLCWRLSGYSRQPWIG